jgi:large subunit ribosomal protein L24
MLKRPKIRKGDTVVVVAGENRGKQGIVLRMIPSKDRVVVEGVNIITKHVRPSAANPQGGLEKMEAPIHISNVMVLDNKGIATRVGRKRDTNGKLVRYAKTTGEEIKQ